MQFPDDFVWGAATAAYQIEGAVTEDGRGTSIWDTFSHTPGKTLNGDTGDIACDHYHRWRDDIGLLKALNVNAYRFSIAWSRILPVGRGKPNPAGIDFYSRLVDGLLEAGITPFATLYHWDLPQAIQDDDGWMRRTIADDFAHYADVISRALGDRVRHWITLNEPWVIAWAGHMFGEHAPGHRASSPAAALTVSHNLNLAHGSAVAVLRQNLPGAKIGTVLNLNPAYPATNKSADMEAATRFDGFWNRWYLDPIFRGHYPADMTEQYAEFLPEIRPGDLDRARVPLDFLGINYYSRAVIQDDADNAGLGYAMVSPEGEYTDMRWEVYPQGLFDLLMRVHRDYAPREIYITENGSAWVDTLTETGEVHDERRTAYLASHLEACSRAIADGVPLKGYFAWSLLDNFEWAFGYSKRFGLYYVDFANQQRYLKDSGKYFARIAGR
ncbi:MAG: beta-glucosidase [Anaerolinea sp.]|nr:beta-glucosidase [Anaerolinea sp.]